MEVLLIGVGTEVCLIRNKGDGSIMAWGNPYFGGKKAPTDSGYTEIYSTNSAFAALKADGSIKAWGNLGQRHMQMDKSWYNRYQQAHLILQNLSHPTP
jgi:hypothetical protein